MSFRRWCRLAAMVLATLLCLACGQVYRPVVIPCTGAGGISGCPVEPPPAPANFHAVFGIYANVPNSPGGALQVDVAGDSIIAETPSTDPKFGDNPTHAAILPNDARVFVASAGSVSGGVDVVSSFTPVFQFSTGFSPVTAISLPSQTANVTAISEAGNLVTVTLSAPLNNIPVGYTIVIAGVAIPMCTPPGCNPNAYDGAFTLTSVSGTTIQYMNPVSGLSALSSGLLSGATTAFPPQPVFVATAQNTAVYVANYNSNSVSEINTSTNLVSNSATVGVHPVSLAETPNVTANGGLKLYVANQGSGTVSSSVSSLNVTDLSSNPVIGFTGVNPVWVVARGDSQRVYVLTQGDGQLVTIDTATDTVLPVLPVNSFVGPGANFIFHDPHLNRLYVTNPVTGTVYVFSDTGGANDTPTLLKAISMTQGANAPCPAGCSPTSVTALPDGSRFYVASYQTYQSPTACPDTIVTGDCVVPGLTVFDANSLTPKITPALKLLTWPPPGTTPGPFAPNQFAVPPVASCAPAAFPALYSPSAPRFRVFTTASVDSSHLYVSMCDAGAIADINTTASNTNNSGGGGTPPDTVIADLPAAFSNGAIQANGEPANQNPIFLLTGQ